MPFDLLRNWLTSCNEEQKIHNAFKKLKLESLTVFENHRKSLIQYYERSDLRLHLEWTKVHQKMVNFGEFFESLKVKQAVLRVLNFDWTKIDEKIQVRHYEQFSNIVHIEILNFGICHQFLSYLKIHMYLVTMFDRKL